MLHDKKNTKAQRDNRATNIDRYLGITGGERLVAAVGTAPKMSEKKKTKKKLKSQAADDTNGIARLSEHLEMQRTRVVCGPDMNYHVRIPNVAIVKNKYHYSYIA